MIKARLHMGGVPRLKGNRRLSDSCGCGTLEELVSSPPQVPEYFRRSSTEPSAEPDPELSARLPELLGLLTPRQMMAFLLNLEYGQLKTAEIMGVSKSCVQRYCQVAREKFRRRLAGLKTRKQRPALWTDDPGPTMEEHSRFADLM